MKTATILASFVALGAAASLSAGENMLGRQSQNEGFSALPAPGAVTIDGDLSDWDWSGRICVFADSNVRNRYSVEAAAMWDADYLYLAAKWLDPTPMFNTVDPDFAPNEGWKSDAWQIRIQSDRVAHFTTWFYEPKRMPVMHISYVDKGFGGAFDVLCGTETNPDLGKGAQMAYKLSDGPAEGPGAGFVQELRIPWNLIFSEVPAIQPGLAIRMGNEFLWGDVTGHTWPVHRYADNMQPGVTSREFYWTAYNAWGNLTLSATGNVEPREYVGDVAKIAGTVPFTVTVPANAARFTLVVEDEQGNRVRNLAADCLPSDYATATDAANGTQTLVVDWDCLNDNGDLVQPGSYHVRGLTHTGLSASYDACFYNPGTPPWDTVDGSGAWGADHNCPCAVAAAGDRIVIGWPGAEGGHAIVVVGPEGRKQWGVTAGAPLLAATPTHVIACDGVWLHRYDVANGAFAPFELGGAPRPFELAVSSVFPEGAAPAAPACALAADASRIAVAFTNAAVAILDPASAAVVATHALPLPPRGIALRGDTLYALVGDARVVALNLASGETADVAINDSGLRASAIAVDAEGRILLADVGPDQQVKAFNAKGKVAQTYGKRGGRARSGKFVPEAMASMSSVAVGSDGRVWVVENSMDPRRVSVWNAKGKLDRDYIGNTGYASRDTYADPVDPDTVYCGPLRMRLDRKAGTWALEEILWSPDPAKNEAFPLWSGSHWYSRPNFLDSDASGKNPHYLHFIGIYNCYHAVYMRRGDHWQPVAAITTYEYLRDALPGLDFGEHDRNCGAIWNDFNSDGAVSPDECEFRPDGILRDGGWGSAPGRDLTMFINDLHGRTVRCRVDRFTRDGAPVYSSEAMDVFATTIYGENRPVADRVISFGGGVIEGGVVMANDLDTGKCLWTYPNKYPQVHGSHRAPMPSPGLLIGSLKFCGIADFGADVGEIFQIRGNLGQDYFMTTDGLFVGTLFEDGRLPSAALPATEAELRGMDLSGFSNGGEPFNGSFVRQSDGQARMTIGLARQAGMLLTVDGFDSVRRFDGPTVAIDDATLVKADADNTERARKASEPKQAAIRRFAAAPAIDGAGGEWGDVQYFDIRKGYSPEWSRVRLGYDDQFLYAFVETFDQSPWKNSGADFARLFKTGDALDFQLGPAADGDAAIPGDPREGDMRILVAPFGDSTAVVLMKPRDGQAPAELHHAYASPVFTKPFDRVEKIDGVQVAVQVGGDRFNAEIAIPWSLAGIEPRQGASFRGDIGFIASDALGRINSARTYWANQFTNLVNDEPSEATFNPADWGVFTLE